MVRKRRDNRYDNEELHREGGVLVSVEPGGREVGPEGEGAPDDVLEDNVNDEGVPGTRDDLPYTYGTEGPSPTDDSLSSIDRRDRGFGSMGETGADEREEEPALGKAEERELWRRQHGLLDEDTDESRNYPGPTDEVPEVERAIGEDAEEPLMEAGEGESATGEGSDVDTAPEHGGFPERKE